MTGGEEGFCMIEAKQLKRQHLVLIVDDFEINRDILGMILEERYEILYAENGVDAMAKIGAYRDRLSIILLDLIMPEMDGYEVLSRVRSDELLRRIPVIVLTAEKDAELRALQMGAADFITKPFDVHEVILARVDRIIELSEGRQLISAAEYDKLTTLYDRNFFFEYANGIFRDHPDWRMDAIVINIEKFHSVNALHGYEFGDKVLKALGEEIRVFLRQTEGIASRSEADHFDIYCRQQDDYSVLISRLQTKMNETFPKASIRLRMGVKQWVEGAEPILQFDQARAACNMVRGEFFAHLMVYDEEMRKREMLEQRLQNDLRAAVDNRDLVVFYQPKYNIQLDPPRLSSAEALIRWNHPELGMISPGVFIPLFEGNGQISILDNYVWAEAAGQIAAWRDKFGVTLPVSVNLSRVDVYDPALEDTLQGLIESNGLEPRDLKLEVTESAYTDNGDKMIEVMDRLRGRGFQIEMDDFGSGYSSLNMLSSLPIDVLKMDMRFVRNIEHSEKDFRLVKMVLDIARCLNVPVIAEGVETHSQMSMLRKEKCDLVQGYYFSRPLPPEEFEQFIRREIEVFGGIEG